MSPREFIGHCYCDSRFKTIENIIKNGTIKEVLALEEINNKMPKFHRHQEVARLLKERLNG
jgi:hemerythrin superfamily protein